MPHNASAKKRLRQAKALLTVNRSRKQEIKSRSKTFLAALESGEIEQAESLLKTVTARIDKAAKKNVLHANKASRIKSGLARALNAARAKASGGAGDGD